MSYYGYWSEITTRNGFVADEVISSLQKSIRKAMVEEACEFAYEMYITSPQLLEKLWRRLLTISVEDIGYGNLEAAGQVNVLNDMRKNFSYADGDQPMFFIHAIRLLCDSTKDRSSDYLKNIIIKGFAMGKKPEILDIALDKHTKRGKAMGRDSFHFFEKAALVTPQLEIDNDYRDRYAKILAEYKPEDAVEGAFVYNKDQE